MFVLRVFLCLFFLLFIHVGQTKACSVGDECTPEPCLNRVDFFGAYSKKSAEYNYHYYDAILVIQPVWGFDEYINAIRELSKREIVTPERDRFSVAPYKVVDSFKNSNIEVKNDENIVWLAMKSNDYLMNSIKYLSSNLLPKTRDVCLDTFSFPSYRDPSQENQFLVFVKKYKEAKAPVIVRLKHIKKHAYESNKKEALEADLIFSAVLETAETIKKKGKEPRKIVRKYKDVKILKKSEALGAGATFTVHKPFFLFGGGKTDLTATVISPSYTHPTGIKRYVKPVYPYPQRNIYYYKQNIEHEDLYELIHVSEDIEWELEQLRKIKSQE